MENLRELSNCEMKETNGGIIWWKYIGVFVASAIVDIITNPDQHYAAFKEGYNSRAPQEFKLSQ